MAAVVAAQAGGVRRQSAVVLAAAPLPQATPQPASTRMHGWASFSVEDALRLMRRA
jgi:hypothetical protein